MKSDVLIASVEATMAPTLTCAVGVNSTPLGLSRNTWPLALMAPWITETSEPNTRLSATALAPGCTKFTVLPAPTEKLCQSTAILPVFCVIVMVEPLCPMAPLPATILPLVGSATVCACANPPISKAAATATAADCTDFDLPLPRAVSATACQVLRMLFQTTR